MATACPDKNCLVLMRHPVFDPVENSLPRGAAAKAALPAESFAVVVAPTVPADGVAYNRVALVLNLHAKSPALDAYRAQLENALKTLDAAQHAGLPNVELTLMVPEELTRPQAGRTGAGTKGKGKEGAKEKTKDKDKRKSAPKKKKQG